MRPTNNTGPHPRVGMSYVKSTVILLTLAIIIALPARGANAQGPGTWEETLSNPIFGEAADGGGPKAYYPSILTDENRFSGHGASARYKMWYGTSSGQTALAISDDGLAWTDQGVVNTNGYHATVEYYAPGFPGANSGDDSSDSTMHYRTWYWPGAISYSIADIRYAESPDGANWHNDQPVQNGPIPIITGVSPDWNRGSYGPCDVLYNSGAPNTGSQWVFTMYYDGTTGGAESIGIAFSSDGITWTGYDAGSDGAADPVLTGTGIAGDWDHDFASRATIIKNHGDDYEMWYSAGDGAMNNGIGYATSSDGITWTRDPGNPIFHKDDTGYPEAPWRGDRTYCPAVVKMGSTYRMWFAGRNSSSEYSLGHAAMPHNTADLALSKTITPTIAAPGQTITYTLSFSNTGALFATGVVISDSLPVSVTATSVISSGVTITQTNPGYVWEVQDLAPYQGGTVTITGILSNPLAAGILTNTAIISSTQDGEHRDSATVTVQFPDIAARPPVLAFGDQGVDAGASQSRTVVITNQGTADLIITQLGLTGAESREFLVESDSGEDLLSPGSERTVQISFDPVSAGPKSASLTILSNDLDKPALEIALTGTGLVTSAEYHIYLPIIRSFH